MRRVHYCVWIPLLLVLCSDIIQAQQRPDFSGTWVTTGPRRPHTLKISQDGARLTVNEMLGSLHHTYTYQLDGSESRYEERGRRR